MKIDSSRVASSVPLGGPGVKRNPRCDSFDMKPISWYKAAGVALFKCDQYQHGGNRRGDSDGSDIGGRASLGASVGQKGGR